MLRKSITKPIENRSNGKPSVILNRIKSQLLSGSISIKNVDFSSDYKKIKIEAARFVGETNWIKKAILQTNPAVKNVETYLHFIVFGALVKVDI